MQTCYKFFWLILSIGDFLKQGFSDSVNESHSIDATSKSVVSLLKTLAITKEDENSSRFTKNGSSYFLNLNESEQHINVTTVVLTKMMRFSTEYVTLLNSSINHVTSTTKKNGKLNTLNLQDQFYIMCAVVGIILCFLCLGYLFLFKDIRRLKKGNRTCPELIQNPSHGAMLNDGPNVQSSRRNIAPDEELARRGFSIYDGNKKVRSNSRSGISNSSFAEENYPMEIRKKPE